MKYVVCFISIVFIFLNSSAAFSAQGQRGTLGDESIAYTKHNLSSYWPADAPADTRTVTSSTTTELCVFCHTPHGSNVEDLGGGVKAPLWNRKLSTTSGYFLYDEVWSPTLEAYRGANPKPSAPTGYSKLCLSCHDGTLAIGNVYNAPNSGGYSSAGTSTISLSGTATGSEGGTVAGGMPAGSGAYTGDTRLIGKNLSNDHPVSFVFDTNLQSADGELAAPDTVIDPTDTRVPQKTLLYPGTSSTRNNVQCTSCHNPHTTYQKFLRMSRWNLGSGDTEKQICLFCHNKPGWTGSSHQTSTKTFDSSLPAPPASNAGLEGRQMTEAGCLACHDTHTTQGAERLLRDAVDSATYTAGGNTVAGDKSKSAIENVCFRCHSRSSATLSTPHGLMDSNATPPPDIWSQFNKASKMPIAEITAQGNHVPVFTMSQPTDSSIPTSYNPQTDYEKVQVGVAGSPSSTYKHVECTDCHNPHRVTSNASASLSGIDRLAGMRGIRVDGTVVQSVSNSGTSGTYRSMVEIPEVCFRCHGDTYDTFIPTKYDSYTKCLTQNCASTGSISEPTRTTAGTPASGNTHGSNKRKEFNPNTPNANTGQNFNSAFHPVATTGRNTTAIFAPGTTALLGGLDRTKTINCTDCHNTEALGAGTFSGTTASPSFSGAVTESSLRNYTESGRTLNDMNRGSAFFSTLSSLEAKGPHGANNVYDSNRYRILRANYNTTLTAANSISTGNPAGNPPFTSFNASNFALCFNCHNVQAFTDSDGTVSGNRVTNFVLGPVMCPGQGFRTLNLHAVHLNNVETNGAWDLNLNMYTACANCHYNVHSNVEAENTDYAGGGSLRPDGATRLVNFSPIIQRYNYTKPAWYYSGGDMRCDLRCHNNAIMGSGFGANSVDAVYNYYANQ